MEKENTSRQRQVTFLEVCGALSQCLAVKRNKVRMLLNVDSDDICERAAPTVLQPCFQLPGSTEL